MIYSAPRSSRFPAQYLLCFLKSVERYVHTGGSFYKNTVKNPRNPIQQALNCVPIIVSDAEQKGRIRHGSYPQGVHSLPERKWASSIQLDKCHQDICKIWQKHAIDKGVLPVNLVWLQRIGTGRAYAIRGLSGLWGARSSDGSLSVLTQQLSRDKGWHFLLVSVALGDGFLLSW